LKKLLLIKLILFDFRHLCYGIYPSSKWGLNEEISESFGLIIPNNIAAGKYKIVMALYDSQSLKILPIGSVELKETLHKVWNSDWFGI
jgi:hypothetical protein